MRKHIYLVFLLCLIACKNEKGNTLEKNKEAKEDVFTVLMNVKVLEDDKFQLFYIDDSPQGKYKIDERIVIPITGSNEFQIVEFALPHKLLPSKFRIDVGEKGFETLIEIREVKLKFNDNLIEINSKVFSRFFQPNIYIKKVDNGYLRTKIDGRCDPFFVSEALLIKKIKLDL